MLLHDAAVAGDLERVRELVGEGADPDAVDHLGGTALISAMRSACVRHRAGEPIVGQVAVAEHLLGCGVDAERRDGFGRTAGDWATGVPGAQAVPGWQPEAAHPEWTAALLSLLRRDLGSRPPASAPADERLPPVLQDLVALLGDPPRVWLRLGYWELEVRGSLGRPDFLDGMDLSALGFDPDTSYELGAGYFNEVLIASWQPGHDEVALWNYDVKAWAVHPLGTLEAFLESLPQHTVGQADGSRAIPGGGEPGGLQDLLDCIDPPPAKERHGHQKGRKKEAKKGGKKEGKKGQKKGRR